MNIVSQLGYTHTWRFLAI